MKMVKAKKINLGGGKTKIPGFINVDAAKLPEVDVVHDLNNTPYPFRANSISEIHCYHVLEHLQNPVSKMEEIYRILKPGGVLHLRVPHFSSSGAFTDMTHVRPFGYFSFDIFESFHPQHYYTKAKYKILKKQIKYFGLYPNDDFYTKYIHANQCPVLARPFVIFLNYLISLSPQFFERFWCYWVGGATEVVIDLKKE